MLIFRLGRIVLHIVAGMGMCGWLFPWLKLEARQRHIRRWSRQLLSMCNVRIEAAPGAHLALAHAMVVANHVSWLDIFVINAVHPCCFIAKAEIRNWPMLGWLSAKAGTVFIVRGKPRDLRHIFRGLVERLIDGERIAFFPEGTTAAQGRLLPFHANLFEAAIDAKVAIQPFALSYVDVAGASHPAVEFVGAMSFGRSIAAILCARPITAKLICLPAIESAGRQRRDLALAAQTAVASALGIAGKCHAQAAAALPECC